MFLTKKDQELIEWMKEFADSKKCSLTELLKGQYDNKLLLQPYDEVSQTGTDEALVRRLSHLMNLALPRKFRNGFVEINVGDMPTGERPDYKESEPNFAASDKVYFIEVEFL